MIVTAGGSVSAKAQLARAASISGVVTAANGSTMAGGRVWASATTGTDFGDAAVGAGGAYTILGLDGGLTYTLQFKPPYPSMVVSEYFAYVYRAADATPFYLAPGSALTGIDTQLTLGGSIAGRVVRRGFTGKLVDYRSAGASNGPDLEGRGSWVLGEDVALPRKYAPEFEKDVAAVARRGDLTVPTRGGSGRACAFGQLVPLLIMDGLGFTTRCVRAS